MRFEIKSCMNGGVLFALETESLSLCLQAAVKSGANLRGANLGGANLGGANLCGANLYGADLGGANLDGADLRGANLDGADLRGANLYGANLGGANLGGANLGGANLGGANLYGADLRGANLDGADLRGTNLYEANLDGAKDISEIASAETNILPVGPIIGWKKCCDNVVVKLLIPHTARRSNATGRKCRAEFVKVLEVFGAEVGKSQHRPSVEYRKGETVRCDKWNEDRWVECGGGIHFFISRIEAEAY